MTVFALLGKTGSFSKSFNPSAKGWRIPKKPTTFGPLRLCIDAITFRSASVRKATATNTGTIIPRILIRLDKIRSIDIYLFLTQSKYPLRELNPCLRHEKAMSLPLDERDRKENSSNECQTTDLEVESSNLSRHNSRAYSSVAPRVAFLDAPEVWQFGFQDPATPIAQGIQDFHNDVCFFMVVILTFVLWMLGRTIWHFDAIKNPVPSKIIHGTVLELAWTVTPSFILMIIAVPSFALLYSMDEITDPAVTLKVIGHQWYWTYEYSDYSTADDQSIIFDSYMVAEDDLELGQLRLLEVDNRVVLPVKTHVFFMGSVVSFAGLITVLCLS
ncbi:unnamed protein product [Bathycoccus prasinos]